jgi:hypothetical protein
MRPRFSLRAFFVFAALVAAICLWCVLPTLAAQQLIRALAGRQYQTADQMFRNPQDRCFEKWGVNHWAFRASGRLAPVTLGQLVAGRREVEFNINYFALDQTVNRDGLIAVTPIGVETPRIGPERFGSLIIDGIPSTTRSIER